MVRYNAKITFLNGPPRSGKDSLANAMWDLDKYVVRMPLAAILKQRTHEALGIRRPWNFYEDKKDEPLDEFFGMTPREAYIWFSESVMKPKFGNDIFARLWFKEFCQWMETCGRVFEVREPHIVVSDTGFIDEVKYIAALFGRQNCTFVQVFREGRDFKNDSRSYLNPHQISYLCARFLTIDNDGSIEDLKQKARMLVEECVA